MNPRFIFNGRLVPADTPVAGPANRGLRYGDGLIETIRCRGGEPLMAEAHFRRLWSGLRILGFECPAHFTHDRLLADMRQLLHANGHTRLARIRLQLYRADGGLYDPVTDIPQYVIESWELDNSISALNSNGLIIGLHEGARKSCDILANLKHCNYLPYILAAREAKQNRWNDALLMNQHNRVCDSSMANLFLIKNQTVYTPALSEGCVAGIMRQHLLQLLPAAGIRAKETTVTGQDVQDADEIFLTNSIRPMRWVQSLGDKKYTNELGTQIYQLLMPTIG